MKLGIPRWAEQVIIRAGLRRYSETRDDRWCALCRTEMFLQLHIYMCKDVRVKALVTSTIRLAVKVVSAMSIESGGERVLQRDMPEERWIAVILG